MPVRLRAATMPARGARATPVPVRHVRLAPSPFLDAFAANRRYLLSLDPEPCLQNFYVSAGLAAPKAVYGGWEAQGIAGHSLGHWLSACAMIVANTGDADVAARLDHALAEMTRIQAAHGDGYVGGTTVERDGKTVDGKVVFEEVRRGDIRTAGFDLNGGWVPLYTWHKVQAGLTYAHLLASNPRAQPVLLAMADISPAYWSRSTDAQMQQVLRAEHGGLNESFADLRDDGQRALAAARQDLPQGGARSACRRYGQARGAARQYPDLQGDRARASARTDRRAPPRRRRALFDQRCPTGHHSYVIGNSEREHSGAPDKLAARVTEATCEACNSYNMMKLTRHLYGWLPEARWFDYYERVQLNHILAHQRPDTGQFVYFMPLASGARRSHSCRRTVSGACVGSGMESHGEHADFDPLARCRRGRRDALRQPLHSQPARLARAETGARPRYRDAAGGSATLTIRRAPRRAQRIALRLPGWAQGAGCRRQRSSRSDRDGERLCGDRPPLGRR
ncbi:beta-L-arabinofuranosidase domain-containing protein [Sphingomonas sp. MMS24-JH45]